MKRYISIAAMASVLALSAAFLSYANPTPPTASDEDASPTTTNEDQHALYDSIDLRSLPAEVELTGTDPKAIALNLFAPRSSDGRLDGVAEQVVEFTQTETTTTVVITRLGLADDSVRDIRYRVEFAPIVVESTSTSATDELGITSAQAEATEQSQLSDQPQPSDQADSTEPAEPTEWGLVWAGQQFRCQPERGSQEWSNELCY